MKILIENEHLIQCNSQECVMDEVPKRNILNVFDMNAIENELLNDYEIHVSVSPKRKWSNDIWYVTVNAPYVGKTKDLINPPKGTIVALFVDYSNNTAFAMPRSGADKQTMMLIASIANKHVRDPFECSSTLRYKLHQPGGDE